MKLCPTHEQGLLDAFQQLAVSRLDKRIHTMIGHAKLLVFEQAKAYSPARLVKTIAHREGTRKGCLICALDSPEWLLNAATDVAEFWKEHGDPDAPSSAQEP